MESYNTPLLLSEDKCNKIKKLYNYKLILRETRIRKQRNYHETDECSWLYKLIDNFIKVNLGKYHSLLQRVTILRYDKGDYFKKHSDGNHNQSTSENLPYHFYGGVELNEKDEFDGGEFFVSDEIVDYKKGRLFTHGFEESHGVKEVTRGTRWSIHFLISDGKKTTLI